MQLSICKRRMGQRNCSQKLQSVSPRLFLRIHAHGQTLWTWHKQPDLIPPAHKQTPRTPIRLTDSREGHSGPQWDIRGQRLYHKHTRNLGGNYPNIHQRSTVLHDYKAKWGRGESKLGAVIATLGLEVIYSGPSTRNETGLCDLTCNKLQKTKSWLGQEMNLAESRTLTQTQHLILTLSFLFMF